VGVDAKVTTRLDGLAGSLDSTLDKLAEQSRENGQQIARLAGALEHEAKRAVALAAVTQHTAQLAVVNSMNIGELNATLAELSRIADLPAPTLSPTPAPVDVAGALSSATVGS
jgi:ABC-type transporter Mla subunit MlaD